MLRKIESQLEKYLTVLNNPVVFALTVMCIGLYAKYIAPKPGPWLRSIIDNTYFKILFFFVVILLAHQDPRLALALAVAFVLTIQFSGNLSIDTKGIHYSKMPSFQLAAPPQPILDTVASADAIGGSMPDRELQYDEITAEDGEVYQIHQDTEAAWPMHPDLIHSSAQALGDPLAGFDPGFEGAQY